MEKPCPIVPMGHLVTLATIKMSCCHILAELAVATFISIDDKAVSTGANLFHHNLQHLEQWLGERKVAACSIGPFGHSVHYHNITTNSHHCNGTCIVHSCNNGHEA